MSTPGYISGNFWRCCDVCGFNFCAIIMAFSLCQCGDKFHGAGQFQHGAVLILGRNIAADFGRCIGGGGMMWARIVHIACPE
jgi:hypothetical protein